MQLDWVYDLETYPNCFQATFMQVDTGMLRFFEISDRRNDLQDLLAFLNWCIHQHPSAQQKPVRFIGYNNLGFDYPVLHFVMHGGHTAAMIYEKVKQIFAKQDGFGANVPADEVLIPQVDLFKIHHFDNVMKRTSLKVLEFNMRSHSVEDLPFPPGTMLTHEQMEVMARYNFHDVAETMKFYYKSIEQIAFRDQLTAKYGRDFTNFNDTKIGKEYFIMQLEAARPGVCFPQGSRSYPAQTPRNRIALADVIVPYAQFTDPELQRILHWFKQQVITETKGVFTDVNCIVKGFRFDFGVGGIHGSVNNRAIHADDDWCVMDIDVTSYYPSLAIANRFYPEHLGELFCDIYADMKAQRVTFKKGSAENAMLKLALNGVYGDSNNQYSPFYDPQYTMSITVNGQLLLCMLAEALMNVPGLELIQINTDGMTMRVQRALLPFVRQIMQWWQDLTKLELEEAFYSSMYVRDVNNYIAVVEGTGKTKRKGAYEYAMQWHQNHSELIIAKAVEAVIVEGADLEQFIYGHPDPFDFMLRGKASAGSVLELEDGQRLSKTIRYYISTAGQGLYKVMPPPPGRRAGDFKQGTGVSDRDYVARNQTGVWDASIHTKNRSTYASRRVGLQVGRKVTVCNRAAEFDRHTIDYPYYINAAKQMLKDLGA